MRFRTVGLLAVIGLVVASCGGGAPKAAGPSEGIQVHGDWTIDIYNEDGSLDDHIEFSNQLSGDAQRRLVQTLTGAQTIGLWSIWFAELGSDLCPTDPLGDCLITDATVSAEDLDGANWEDAIRLTGSSTVEADGTINFVATSVGFCPPDTAPDSCVDQDSGFYFTSKNLDVVDQKDVVVGQVVGIQVDISFTSG